LFDIYLSNRAESTLKHLPDRVKRNLKELIDSLQNTYFPRSQDVKKMKGMKNTYRIRMGDYRLIYRVDFEEKKIFVLSIAHRKKAYKQM